MTKQKLNTANDWPGDPFGLFQQWFDRAKLEGAHEPEAMALSTCTADGRPSARMVLMRGFSEEGVCFYTNYESRKGCELIANPHAAVIFYWPDQYLQVRIEGRVEQLSAEQSDAYFYSRNRSKQASACSSNQSRPIGNWSELRTAADALLASDETIKRPEYWGGFVIRPSYFEFWAGSQDRMHRRCTYCDESGGWKREMLAP